MKTLITAIIVGIFLFGGSAAASYFLLMPPEETAEEIEQEDSGELQETFVPSVEESDKVPAMPVSLRPETPLTVEAVTELAQSIMKKEQALIDDQRKLQQEKKRIEILFEDLKRERDELKALGERIDAKVIQAREAMEGLKLEKESIQQQTKTLSKLEKKTGKTSKDVVKDALDDRVTVAKNWFKGLDPPQAADFLKEFANRGDLEFAARLLDSLEDRQVAKILAALNDAPLVAQIVDAYTKKKSTGSRFTR
ncbi:MAG: hypothetical protein AB8B55_00115 [Mariniblastus sp.]